MQAENGCIPCCKRYPRNLCFGFRGVPRGSKGTVIVDGFRQETHPKIWVSPPELSAISEVIFFGGGPGNFGGQTTSPFSILRRNDSDNLTGSDRNPLWLDLGTHHNTSRNAGNFYLFALSG